MAPVDDDRLRSRINIVTSGTEMVIGQIKAQLDRLVPVHRVADLTADGPHVAREMALIKVCGTGEKPIRSAPPRRRVPGAHRRHHAGKLRVRAHRGDDKLDAFIDLLRPLGLAEISRTGIAAIARGTRTI